MADNPDSFIANGVGDDTDTTIPRGIDYDIRDPLSSCKLPPRTLRTAAGTVEFAEFGEGPPVVALHGADEIERWFDS